MAQSFRRERYLLIGSDFNLIKIQDRSISPLKYSGYSVGGMIGYKKYKNRRLSYVNITADGIGNAKPIIENNVSSSLISIFFIDAHGAGMWNVLSENHPYRIYVGYSIRGMAYFRTHNNYTNSAFSYDFYGNMGVIGRYERDIKLLGKDWILSYDLEIPIFGYASRPQFSTISNFIGQDLFEEDRFEWVFFTSFSVIYSVLGIQYKLKNNNRIGLQYVWLYYETKLNHNQIKLARHGFNLFINWNF